MEQLNSDNVAINSDKSSTVKIQVSTHFQRNGRRKLEDRYVVENDLNSTFDLDLPHKYRYYAIFDGHVNENAAEFCKDRLHINLVLNDKFKNGQISEALRETFMKTDTEFCEKIGDSSNRPGTTALVCLIEDDKRLYLAWAGDSTSILIRNGEPIEITYAHTPEREEERERIKEMGGECMYTNIWRVMGILAVSRSIGDPDYKPFVTAEPDINVIELEGNEDFLILASDGLWDSLTPDEASTIVYQYLAVNADQQPDKVMDGVSKFLIKRSVEEGSSDNITAIVLFFKDLKAISPSITQNGHQNGHKVNGTHFDDGQKIATDEELIIKENGNSNNDSFPLNVNAQPFSPNNDLFNKISMSGIDLINSLREKSSNDAQQPQVNINITSNEDNTYDDNLCAVSDEMITYNENDANDEPHSILPNINQELIKNTDKCCEDDEIERELDEERVVIKEETSSSQQQLKDLIEEENLVDEIKNDVVIISDDHEEQQQLKETVEKENQISLDQETTVNCEYSVIPTELIASPVDLISESTTDELTESKQNEKDSTENLNLPVSPFEQIEEQQSPINDVVIKVNDKTFDILDVESPKKEEDNELELKEEELKVEDDLELKEEEKEEEKLKVEEESKVEEENLNDVVINKQDEEDDKSEEASFEFIENTEVASGQSNDQNTTQYISPENSNLSKLVDFQDESIYENANAIFANSMFNQEIFQNQQEDKLENNDESEDSEDSIRYFDKTVTDETMTNQVMEEKVENKDFNELADLMQSANINTEENPDRTFNLLIDENNENNENNDELNKENVPESLSKPSNSNLLDSTLVFNGNPPNIIPPFNQLGQQIEQINEDHFNDNNDNDNDNDKNQMNDLKASNFELIRDEEINQQNKLDMEMTNNVTEDMDITFLQQKTFETPTVINDDFKVPNEKTSDNLIHNQDVIKNEFNDEAKVIDQSCEYIEANEDSSFVLNKIEQPVEQTEASKDNFVILETPIINNESELINNNEIKTDDNQISELKTEFINDQQEEDKISKPEIVDEKTKSEIDDKSDIVLKNTATSVAASAAVAATALAVTKKAKTSASATKSILNKSANSAKLTKDTKSTVKDSKSTLAKDKPAAKSSLTSKPLPKKSLGNSTTTTTTTTNKPTSTITRKPLASSTTRPTSTVNSKLTSTTLTKPAPKTTTLTKSSTAAPKPAVSKISSTVRSTVSSRLTSAPTASSKPIAKSTTSTISNKPSSTLTSKSTLSSKITTTSNKPALSTSRPTSTVNKYANITSKVSSSLTASTKPSTTNSKPTTTASTAKPGLTIKRTALTNTLKSATTTKPSSTPIKKLSNVTSKVSSIRSTTANLTSKVNHSKPTSSLSNKVGLNKSNTSTTSASTTVSNKKTAVPRKPVNKQPQNNSSTTEPKKTEPNSNNQADNENSSSIKPNNILNGQQMNNSLTNGDQSVQQQLNATTPTSMSTSKSRDKLTTQNSLRSEIEVAMKLARSTNLDANDTETTIGEINGNGLPK